MSLTVIALIYIGCFATVAGSRLLRVGWWSDEPLPGIFVVSGILAALFFLAAQVLIVALPAALIWSILRR